MGKLRINKIKTYDVTLFENSVTVTMNWDFEELNVIKDIFILHFRLFTSQLVSSKVCFFPKSIDIKTVFKITYVKYSNIPISVHFLFTVNDQ